MHFASLNPRQLRAAQRAVLTALGLGPDSTLPPGAEGPRLQVLLRGRQDVLPLVVDVPVSRGPGPALVRGVAPTVSFPDLMTRALDADEHRKGSFDPQASRFGLSVGAAERDTLLDAARALDAVPGPTPWPEPLDAPNHIRVTLTRRARHAKQLTRVFDDHVPRAVRQGLDRLLAALACQIDPAKVRVLAACRAWRERLRGLSGEPARAGAPSPPRQNQAVLSGILPSVEVAYHFDDYLLYSPRDAVLTYKTRLDAASLRHVELATGDVTNVEGLFSDAPGFRVSEVERAFPLTRCIAPSTQLPLRIAAPGDLGEPLSITSPLARCWALHYDAQMAPVLGFLRKNCPAVVTVSRRAPQWPSAALIGLHGRCPSRFQELVGVAPAALLLLTKEPARLKARRPIEAALEVWGLPAQRWLRRWLQRVDPRLISPAVLRQLGVALRDGPAMEGSLKTRLSHGLLESPSALMAALDPAVSRHLGNADLRLLVEADATEESGRPRLYERLRSLIEAAEFLGIEPPVAGLRDRAKAHLRGSSGSTMEAAYEHCVNQAAGGYAAAMREADVLRRLGVDRVGIPPSVVAQFAHRDQTLEAVPLATQAAIRGWGLDERGGDNCLGTSDHLLIRALCGRQLFVGLKPPGHRRFRKGTLALAPVFHHSGPWCVVQLEGAGNRQMTPPAREAFNGYLDALEARGVQIVSRAEAHHMRHGIEL